jgi:hypothetical protein
VFGLYKLFFVFRIDRCLAYTGYSLCSEYTGVWLIQVIFCLRNRLVFDLYRLFFVFKIRLVFDLYKLFFVFGIDWCLTYTGYFLCSK